MSGEIFRAAMRVQSYRIVGRKFATKAFSGEGARLYGGRWNSIGTAVVYTSSSISLAILEWRAHLTQWPAPSMVIIEIEFNSSLVWVPPKLPSGWMQYPRPDSNADVGDHRIKSGRSAIIKLPSAIVPAEYNYLLNPAHPDFSKITMGKQRVFRADPRLVPLASEHSD